MILETKGYDMRKELKVQAARRWVDAVNAGGSYGRQEYVVVESVGAIDEVPRQISKPSSEVQ